ncbi:hypothetical protein SKAU_G00326290 [Synaphobranchus kaupii]|uniref:G-protein coupled receptors family 1 profile domain-containing protein n=1 Tax=Synaphobranchus kaupii TaxID=118154 RepID=A0A9Q1EPN0_SYNKA|nr:hypothetical protein SKAU_G00326290 [Synaphobranchus kaupii]
MSDRTESLTEFSRKTRMNNVTYNSPIVVIKGVDLPHRFIYPVFALVLVTYLMILITNIGVMLLIMMDRSLQQPMYLLFYSLAFNDILGNTVFLPQLMLDVVSTERSISYPSCVSQAFFSHTYGTSCHTVMMIMAFDRYVAICHPLRYTSIMTPTMVTKLTVSAWSTSITLVSILLGLTIPLTRCHFVITHACNNASLYKLSCQKVTINNIYGLTFSVAIFGSSICSVVFTYFRILVSCVSRKNKEMNKKALQTCATHLLLYSYFPMKYLHNLGLQFLGLQGVYDGVHVGGKDVKENSRHLPRNRGEAAVVLTEGRGWEEIELSYWR